MKCFVSFLGKSPVPHLYSQPIWFNGVLAIFLALGGDTFSYSFDPNNPNLKLIDLTTPPLPIYVFYVRGADQILYAFWHTSKTSEELMGV